MVPGVEKSPVPRLLTFNMRFTIKSSDLDDDPKKYLSLALFRIV